MSKFPDNDKKDADGFNDTDLSALFANDNTEPPAELDKFVLDNARLSHHDEAAAQTETFTQKYAPIFGTAAVLMIGIALTPMTMQAPDSELGQSSATISVTSAEQILDTDAAADVSADAIKAAKVEVEVEVEVEVDTSTGLAADASNVSGASDASSVAEAITMAPIDASSTAQIIAEPEKTRADDTDASFELAAKTNEEIAQPTAGNDRIAPDTSLRLNATADSELIISEFKPTPIVPNAFTANESQKDQKQKLAKLSAEVEKRALNRTNTDDYRSSALLWVIEIKKLFNTDKKTLAEEELALFRKKYPNNSNERLLPKALREQ